MFSIEKTPFTEQLKSYILGSRMNLYGMSEIVSCWCKYPKWLPFRFEMHHGWYILDKPSKFDLESHKPVLLMFNKRQKETWEKDHKKPAVVIGAPFIHYRRCKNIKQSSNAQGTIAFPQHSRARFDVVFDIDKYCHALNQLPDYLKPITICLHIHDMRRNRAPLYEINGFKVVTAGERDTIAFAKNFYDILKNYKYATSNIAGSHTMYAIEMGIPFFLHGESGYYLGSPEEPQSEIGLRVEELFSVPLDRVEITAEQREFVESEAGINDCINPEELRKLLLKIFFCKSIPIAIYRLLRIPYVIIKRIYNMLNRIFMKNSQHATEDS